MGLVTRNVGRTQEKLVNHEPKASDLQALQTSQVGYHAGKPMEVWSISFIK